MNLSQDWHVVAAEAFNALGHPARLKILDLLGDGEACVCHIQAMLDMRQAYISQHLNVLKRAGLVTSRKEGLRVYYQICDERWPTVIEEVKEILPSMGELQTSFEPASPARSKQSCSCPECRTKTVNRAEDMEEISYA